MLTVEHKSLCNLHIHAHAHSVAHSLSHDASHKSEGDTLQYFFAQSGQSKIINVMYIKFEYKQVHSSDFCMVVMYNKIMTHDILTLSFLFRTTCFD